MNSNPHTSSETSTPPVARELTTKQTSSATPVNSGDNVVDLSRSYFGSRSPIPTPHIDLSDIRQRFMECFVSQGYREQPAAKLSSGVDPTVIFVGSNINGLKSYILNGIPSEGVVIDQPSMRFRELHNLFDPTYKPVYGTFFNEMGAIVSPSESMPLAKLFHRYLTSDLGMTEDDIVVRVSSQHPDLLSLAEGIFSNLEIDSRPISYYHHTIGEPGFLGRNFNVASRNVHTGNFDDIGNFIAFQRDGVEAFSEVAIGDTVILKAMRGLDHVIDCYDIKLPSGLDRIETLNFKNAVIVATVLYREGLQASNRNNQERILLKYARYISLLGDSKGFGPESVRTAIRTFEESYFRGCSGIDEKILSDLKHKEASFRKNVISGEPSKASQQVKQEERTENEKSKA